MTTEFSSDETQLRDQMEAIGTRHRVGVYGWIPNGGGVNYFRVAEPLRVLAELGNNVGHGVGIAGDILSTVDTLLIHTPHTPETVDVIDQIDRLQSHRIIIDVDDWLWEPDFQGLRNYWQPTQLERLFHNIRRAHVVTTPSPAIAEYLTQYNPNVWYVPNTIPAWLLTHQMPRPPYPVLGLQCSDSHFPDLTQPVLRSISRFMTLHEDWHFSTYGQLLGPDTETNRFHHYPWFDSVDQYYANVSMDIGIGPARDTRFNRGKSALRAIEYAALGIVAVLPDLPIYRGWVEDGVTGRLVGPSRTLASVLHETINPITRRQMATEARRRAAGWTTEANIGRWLEAWHSQ